ncbi:MAG: hypothetical protein ACRD1E_09540 [Terriglobales bacterium]
MLGQRSFPVIALAFLAVMQAWAGARLWQWDQLRVSRFSDYRDAVISQAGAPQFLAAILGIGASGTRVPAQPAGPGRAAVVFVLRAGSLEADLGRWDAVARQLSGKRILVGVCDSEDCGAAIAGRHPAPPFPVAIAGDYASLRILIREDRRGDAVVAERNARVIWRIPWRNGMTTAQLGAQIGAIQ